jgi:hypothetical protein
MNSRASFKQIQHGRVHNKQFNLYEQLQDEVSKQSGVSCSIRVNCDYVSIRTKDWADYYIARSIIRGRVVQEIRRDKEVLGEQRDSRTNTVKGQMRA